MSDKLTILIVDDDANSLIALCDLLTEGGYNTIIAEDGNNALEKVMRENPAVAIVDVRLPGIDGYQVCQRIKEAKEVSTKVILYTAYIDAVNAAKAREVGADDIIGKTSDFENMRKAIKDVIDS